MVGASLDDLSHKPIKFVCSYGGRILPRYPDGKLRYHGGETRVLSVYRSVSFSELLVKLGEMSGTEVSLRCQLPTEDLDALVSITSDEDLANLIEEYDRAPPSPIKIRAFLSAPKSIKKLSSPPSPASSPSNEATSPKSPFYYAVAGGALQRCPTSGRSKFGRHALRPPLSPAHVMKSAGKFGPNKYTCQRGNGGHVYLIHNGNHWL